MFVRTKFLPTNKTTEKNYNQLANNLSLMEIDGQDWTINLI